MAEIRLPRALYHAIREDLERQHRFAYERVGFAFGKLANLSGEEPLVLLYRYLPVADEHYVRHPRYLACIGQEAILGAMQEVRTHRGTADGVFHVHLHDHRGPTGFSAPDQDGLPPLIPGFQRMGPDGAHGLLVLSQDHGLAWIWLPGKVEPVTASRIAVVGAPLEIWEGRG